MCPLDNGPDHPCQKTEGLRKMTNITRFHCAHQSRSLKTTTMTIMPGTDFLINTERKKNVHYHHRKQNNLENFSGLKEKLSRPVVDTKTL